MNLRPEEAAPAGKAPDMTVTVECVTAESRAAELLEQFRQAERVTVLALPDLSGVIVDCGMGTDTALSAEFFFERYTGDWNALLNALFAADIRKVSHNVKDLMRTLLENGLNAEGFMFDTALAAYLVDATSGKYEIGQLFAGYFHTELVKPVYLEPDAFSLLGDSAAAEAAFRSDTAAVGALYEVLLPRLKELNLWELYTTAELPLCRVLAEMELAGCRVDKGALVSFGEMLSEKAAALEQNIYSMAGEEFNINSPKQLGEILFGKLGLPHGKKTKTGWSTNADVLEKLRYEAPIVGGCAGIPAVRQAEIHLCGRPSESHGPGRPHPHPVPDDRHATGRLSSREPNLQNIPTRTDLGSEIRRMFIPAEGCVLVDADYSQIELRLLAHISGDRPCRRRSPPARTSTPPRRRRCSMWTLRCDPRDAPPGEGRELRYRLRHFRLFPEPGHRRHGGGGESLYGGLFCHLPRCAEVYGRRGGKGEGAGVCRDAVPPAAGAAGDPLLQFQSALLRGACGAEYAHSGHGGGHYEAGHGGRGEAAETGTAVGKLVLQVHDELIVECREEQAEVAARMLEEEMEQVAPSPSP